MAPIYLPRELIDQIFQGLDKPSLASCSTICRNYHPSARHFLFRTITLVEPDDDIHNEPRYVGFCQFLTWTSSISSSLSANIRELNLYFVEEKSKLDEVLIDTVMLEQLLSLLPVLRTLRIRMAKWKRSDHLYAPSFPPKNLETLVLDYVLFDLPRWSWVTEFTNPFDPNAPIECTLVELLNIFGDVETLHFTNALMLDDYGSFVGWQDASALASSVSKIVGQQVSSTLHGSRALDSLCHLELMDEDVHATNSMLEFLGLRLKQLRLLYSEMKVPDRVAKVDLSHCTSLSQLELQPYFQALVDVASRIPRTVKHLTVKLEYNPIHYEPTIWNTLSLDWSAVDCHLSKQESDFSVTFVFENIRPSPNATNFFEKEFASLKRHLPITHRMGNLVTRS
ncbi:hypothetical protein EIP91_009433 [Steccherinum ochraceum]|uniref:F-box domain-containing protein n=1 Tax=Steccherinum ochraceum TaxID=92696 RepID=A0A4R0R1M2_9APHY|nr:hypothetical protein EIP91_009433 [Steccherinum ochraceum]